MRHLLVPVTMDPIDMVPVDAVTERVHAEVVEVLTHSAPDVAGEVLDGLTPLFDLIEIVRALRRAAIEHDEGGRGRPGDRLTGLTRIPVEDSRAI